LPSALERKPPRFYPNKKQWVVIWITFPLGAMCLTGGEFAALGILVLVVGALLIWQFAYSR
jgi:hypothetical protein